MKLKKIYIQNFLSIGSMEIDFDNFKSLTLIEGINDDSTTASSNGAGKSSIFEAIYWVLYGKTKRGLIGDAVINESAKKACEVAITFDGYEVKRGRNPNFLTISKDGNDLTKGTIKDTQAILEEIIGMSELTFSKVSQFGQGDVKDFAALTDAELKQIFEQSLGLGVFTEKLQRAKELKSELLGKQSNVQQDVDNLKRDIGFVIDKIETLEKAKQDMINQREGMIASFSSEMNDEMKKLKERQIEAEEKDASINKAAKELEKAASLMKDVSEQKTNAQKEWDVARGKRESINRDVRMYSLELKREMDALNNMPQECSQCKRPYDKESLRASANVIAERIRKTKQSIDKAKGMEDIALQEESRLQAKFESIARKFETLAQVQSQVSALNVARTHLTMLKKEIDAATNRINYIDSQIDSLKKQSNGNDAEIINLKNKLKKAEEDLKEKEANVKTIEHDISITKQLEEILGNGGLKSYIFDNITPELNRVVAEYMNILNPAISIEISTISKLKSGEYRDKFSITVNTDNGAAEYKGNSAGERQLVNLAIALGFNSICRTISQSSVNFLFLDEPFESLDETASEKAVELCKRFAASIDSPFIISHNPAIKDLVVNKITVRKSQGKATLLEGVPI